MLFNVIKITPVINDTKVEDAYLKKWWNEIDEGITTLYEIGGLITVFKDVTSSRLILTIGLINPLKPSCYQTYRLL